MRRLAWLGGERSDAKEVRMGYGKFAVTDGVGRVAMVTHTKKINYRTLLSGTENATIKQRRSEWEKLSSIIVSLIYWSG
jgi:hypothetical protein